MSLTWIHSGEMSCLVSNVSLCQGFSHAQLDSQSIEYFTVICALRWLGMKKGCVKVRQATSVLWPSMLLPAPLSLPKHFIPSQPSPVLKENAHWIHQRLKSDHKTRKEWMFLFGIEMITVWGFSKAGDGSLYIDVPLLYFYDQRNQPWTYFSINSALLALSRSDHQERTLTEKGFPECYMV